MFILRCDDIACSDLGIKFLIVWDADTSRCKKAKHAHNSILCDQSIHICIYFTSSIAWLCIMYRGVSARHRAGQKAREGDAGLTCGGA